MKHILKMRGISDIACTLRIHNEAVQSYEKHPDNVYHVLNYALQLHTVTHDFALAKIVYRKAQQLDNGHLGARVASGLLMLSTQSTSRGQVLKECLRRFDEANVLDPEWACFRDIEYQFFVWAVLRNPTSEYSWLNCALIEQYLYHNYHLALQHFRKALEVNASSRSVLQVHTPLFRMLQCVSLCNVVLE